MTTEPFQVIAVTRTDGWVVLGSYETKQARDTALRDERQQFQSNGTQDVLDIIPLDIAYAPQRRAEEAEPIALALMAQFEGTTRQVRMKGL